MNVVESNDLEKYSVSLATSSHQDLKHPFMFLGHKGSDVGQIWLLSEKENKWKIYSKGTFDNVQEHWNDLKPGIRSNEEVAVKLGLKTNYPLASAEPNSVMGSHLNIQTNCWLDLSVG